MEALEELFTFSPYHLECYAENGNSYTAMVEWDFCGIDLSAVGLYYAKGNLPPPENTVFAQALNLPEISIPISVQASGKPDINCMLAGRGNLYFPWVTPPGNLEEVSVWLSENNGPWICLEDGVYVGAEMLSIATRLLTYGSSYHLQADYDGGQTDILSFTYSDEIVLEGYHEGDRDGGDAGGNPPDDIVQPSPEPPGNADGSKENSDDRPPVQSPDPPADTQVGDSGKNDAPSIQENDSTTGAEQPHSDADTDNGQKSESPNLSGQSADGAPQPQTSETEAQTDAGEIPRPLPLSLLKPSREREEADESSPTVPAESRASENAAFLESFGETIDRISGVRFFMMLQAGNQRAVFPKQGITISIPKDALPDGIQNEDQIVVTIQKEQDGGFSFLFSINGTSPESLPGVFVMLPYSGKPAADTLYLLDENGAEYSMAGYDDTAKAASFQIDHTGTYTIAVKEDTAASLTKAAGPESHQPFARFPVLLFLLVLSASVFFIKRG